MHFKTSEMPGSKQRRVTADTSGRWGSPGCYKGGMQLFRGFRSLSQKASLTSCPLAGHQALGSLNLGFQVAARVRTMSPVTKLPESLCRKKRNVTDGHWRRKDDVLEMTWPKTTRSCFLVSPLSRSVVAQENLPSDSAKWSFISFSLTSSL